MSLISDALAKAQQQQQAAAAGLAGPRRRPPARSTPRQARLAAAVASPELLGVNILLFIGCLGCALLAVRAHPPAFLSPLFAAEPPAVSTPPASPPAAPAAVATSSASASAARPSPPAAPAPVPVAVPAPEREPAPTRDFVLAGVTSLGADTLLSISRVQDRRSVWVAVGKSASGITAVSYDPATDRAVIRVQDRLLRIALAEPDLAAPPTATTE